VDEIGQLRTLSAAQCFGFDAIKLLLVPIWLALNLCFGFDAIELLLVPILAGFLPILFIYTLLAQICRHLSFPIYIKGLETDTDLEGVETHRSADI
jgi:hypothetical protein